MQPYGMGMAQNQAFGTECVKHSPIMTPKNLVDLTWVNLILAIKDLIAHAYFYIYF